MNRKIIIGLIVGLFLTINQQDVSTQLNASATLSKNLKTAALITAPIASIIYHSMNLMTRGKKTIGAEKNEYSLKDVVKTIVFTTPFMLLYGAATVNGCLEGNDKVDQKVFWDALSAIATIKAVIFAGFRLIPLVS